MAEKVYKKHRLAQQRPRRRSALYDWPTSHSVTLRIVHARASLSPHTAASAATTTTTSKGGVRRTCGMPYLIDVLLTAEDEELTPTMKLKRSLINRKYAELIESMYARQAA